MTAAAKQTPLETLKEVCNCTYSTDLAVKVHGERNSKGFKSTSFMRNYELKGWI